MANLAGPQPDVRYCPVCKSDLKNIPRNEMISRGHVRKDGSVAEHTHTYDCRSCGKRFKINQAR